MPYVDARADGALARFQILPDGVQCGIFHDQYQIRRCEHRRQNAVLEAAGKMMWFDAQRVGPARADRYLLHGIKFTDPGTTTARFLGVSRAACAKLPCRQAHRHEEPCIAPSPLESSAADANQSFDHGKPEPGMRATARSMQAVKRP